VTVRTKSEVRTLPAPDVGLIVIVIDWSFGWRFQSTIFRKRRS